MASQIQKAEKVRCHPERASSLSTIDSLFSSFLSSISPVTGIEIQVTDERIYQSLFEERIMITRHQHESIAALLLPYQTKLLTINKEFYMIESREFPTSEGNQTGYYLLPVRNKLFILSRL